MPSVEIPWGSWYPPGGHTLTFPESCDVAVAYPKGRTLASPAEIAGAFKNPVGSPRIRDLARGRRSAAIAIDDLTRPTDGKTLLPYVVDELRSGGIEKERISIILAVGSHRAMTQQDIEKKVGRELARRFRVLNHSPFSNLVSCGTTSSGSPISVNRDFADAQVRIAVGSVLPHGDAGWGGGAKIVMPGLCGIETMKAVHGGELHTAFAPNGTEGKAKMREEIEEIAERIGLGFIVNVVGNDAGQPLAVVTGAPRAAHKKGVEVARSAYRTVVNGQFDIAVFNAFPEDTELSQSGKALNYLLTGDGSLPVKDGGSLIITTAASEGHGVHYLMDRAMPLYQEVRNQKQLMSIIDGKWKLHVFSPNISVLDRETLSSETELSDDWGELIRRLLGRHCPSAHVVVFPCGPAQINP